MFRPPPPSIPASQATICSPTQLCPATPSPSQSNSRSPLGPLPRSNAQPHTSTEPHVYGFDLNEHWQAGNDHHHNHKINGLTFSRTIRSAAFTQKLDIEGCDPLALPLAALLYQQANNHWLRKVAQGKELYVIPTGDIAAVVFATELLSHLRNRGVDLDSARQDGKTMDKTSNTEFAAQVIAEQIQGWVPIYGPGLPA